METQPQQILDIALTLPPSERAKLVATLIRSLDDAPDPESDSNSDKLRLVTQLWEDIASSTEPVVVPPDIIAEASRRSAELVDNPALAIDDEELWRRVDG